MVTLDWVTEKGAVDLIAQRAILESRIAPLIAAADSVTILGSKFKKEDFYGDAERLTSRISFNRGKATIPDGEREFFSTLKNYWSGRSKNPPNPESWRGDIAVVLEKRLFDPQQFFAVASNPMVISNYWSGMAKPSVRLLDEFKSEAYDDKVFLLFPASRAPGGVFVSSGPRSMQRLVDSAIHVCHSTIELYFAPIPASHVASKVAASRKEARELVSRLRHGRRKGRIVE